MTGKFSFQRCIDLVFRYKWYIIIPALFFTVVAVGISMNVPKKYRTRTVILVEPKKVPDNYVRSTVSLDLGQQLSSITPQVMNRQNLQKVIEKYNLHKGRNEPVYMDKLIAMLKRSINISVEGKTSFSITCTGREPELIKNITNMLAALFIEENLAIRAKQARQTSDFLEAELVELKKELERQEGDISLFKRRYTGELPSQREANLRMLDSLQIQLQTNDAALRMELDRKSFLEQQMNTLINNSAGSGIVGLTTQLRALREELTSLKAIYTEKHPDVIAKEMEVENLARKLEEQKRNAGDSSQREELIGDPQYRELQNQIAAQELEINGLREEQENLKEQITVYQSRVNSAPRREQELLTLTRDYENTRENYQALLDKKLEAQLAENLEKKQQGEQFRILDPAVKPVRPFSPQKPLYGAVGLFLGLTLGCTIVVVKEFFDHSFHNADELSDYIEYPVLISIPKIITEEELRRQRLKRAVVISTSFILLTGMAAVFIKFYFLVD
jgi:polysaccharide chain length determinant protein (PEP-CTERM system associated)